MFCEIICHLRKGNVQNLAKEIHQMALSALSGTNENLILYIFISPSLSIILAYRPDICYFKMYKLNLFLFRSV
jgi:hypothetical protein